MVIRWLKEVTEKFVLCMSCLLNQLKAKIKHLLTSQKLETMVNKFEVKVIRNTLGKMKEQILEETESCFSYLFTPSACISTTIASNHATFPPRFSSNTMHGFPLFAAAIACICSAWNYSLPKIKEIHQMITKLNHMVSLNNVTWFLEKILQ